MSAEIFKIQWNNSVIITQFNKNIRASLLVLYWNK